MKHKHLLWMMLVAGMTIFNCSSANIHTTQEDGAITLPGMPAPADSSAISEPDGLIGVEPEHTFETFYLLDSTMVTPN